MADYGRRRHDTLHSSSSVFWTPEYQGKSMFKSDLIVQVFHAWIKLVIIISSLYKLYTSLFFFYL